MEFAHHPSHRSGTDELPPSPLSVHRFAAGLSRQELADRAAISRTGLINLERGESRPRLDTARALADALGVEVEEIFPRVSK